MKTLLLRDGKILGYLKNCPSLPVLLAYDCLQFFLGKSTSTLCNVFKDRNVCQLQQKGWQLLISSRYVYYI